MTARLHVSLEIHQSPETKKPAPLGDWGGAGFGNTGGTHSGGRDLLNWKLAEDFFSTDNDLEQSRFKANSQVVIVGVIGQSNVSLKGASVAAHRKERVYIDSRFSS